MKIVSCKNISKSYPGRKVLKDFNIELESGKIYGFLGRNGAGKTTLLNIITNRLRIKKGEVFLFEEKICKDSLQKVCYMSDYMKDFEGMRVGKILRRAAKAYPKWNKRYEKDLLDRFQLGRRQIYGKMSKGQTTCVGIIIALASGCELVILDEIYAGLDAILRKELYDLILDEYERTRRTFLLSSHLIEEMDTLFSDIIIMKEGRLLLQDSYESVIEQTYLVTGRPDLVDLIPDDLILSQETAQNMTQMILFGKKCSNYFDVLKEHGASIEHGSLQDIFVGMLSEEE